MKFGLTKEEERTLRRLSTPIKIQNFLDSLPMNWEKKGDTHMSPRRVLQEKRAHCIEGALLAAAALWLAGEPPLIMNLSSRLCRGGEDPIVAPFNRKCFFGSLNKTNY